MQEESHQQELEQLKEEILSEIRPDPKKKNLAWNSILITTVLCLLTIVSLAQVVQSVSILNKIKSGAIKPANAAADSGSSLPSDIQNLPNMVGGC